MKKTDIARAWTDEDYYLSLSAAERRELPANPAAMMTMNDQDLGLVNGAAATTTATCHGTVLCTPCGHILCGA